MKISFLLMALLPCAISVVFAQTIPSTKTTNAAEVGKAPKIKVVRHNNNICPVTGANVSGEHQKYEMIYVVGNVAHHFYLARQSVVKQFNKNPTLYMNKLELIEQGSR